MQDLIIRRGLSKRAAGEDGPSFEQQFGILTNAVIVDKFPQLDSMKLAFQLIEKSDDNSEACGAAVYTVGQSVIFVPSFFKNNKLHTGDMMLIADTQQFLPLSDPWLSWIKNKDLNSSGEEIPAEIAEEVGDSKGTTVRDISDPIIKTASVYLKGLLKVDPDFTKTASDTHLLETVIGMGKKASSGMLDLLIGDTNYLNAALNFYSADELDTFAKVASYEEEEAATVELILPLDKEAKSLNEQELAELHRDGYFIRKTAAADDFTPNVIEASTVPNLFVQLGEPGSCKVLRTDGTLTEAFALLQIGSGRWDITVDKFSDCCLPSDPWGSKEPKFVVAIDGTAYKMPAKSLVYMEPSKGTADEAAKTIGKPIEDYPAIPSNCVMVFPDRSCFIWDDCLFERGKDGWTDGMSVLRVDNSGQVARPYCKGDTITLPKGTRILNFAEIRRDGEHDNRYTSTGIKYIKTLPDCVTLATLPSFLEQYHSKNNNKVRLYSNGNEFTISGDKTEGTKTAASKEAAFELVSNYGISPDIAKEMLKQASAGASYYKPVSKVYYIDKSAADYTETANIGYKSVADNGPVEEQVAMPELTNIDVNNLKTMVTNAAANGVKEVFDVGTMLLLTRQNHFFDEIQDDLPLFMRTLDSLCKKLFQFYWHTDKMEEKYGMVKMKYLEETIKCTLDSLSELTIFFKLRTVDGSGITGDTAGDLMSGTML